MSDLSLAGYEEIDQTVIGRKNDQNCGGCFLLSVRSHESPDMPAEIFPIPF